MMSAMSLAVVCIAQATSPFNTIANKPSLYKIKKDTPVSEITETAMSVVKNSESRENDTIVSKNDDVRKRLLYDYLSVSLPLKSIHISSPFGKRTDPINGKKAKHNGLDLKAKFEESYAMMPGQVVKVGQDKRSGIFVTLKYGDYTVSYCHLSQPLVKKGEWVSPGDVVAITGNTGRSTGPHLHLTTKFKGKAIDPAFLLNFVRETQSRAYEQLKLIL